MKKNAAPIPFAGSELNETRHVCAFFNSDEEGYRVLLPFIKDGFACGDKAVHVVNSDQHGEHLRRLTAVGIDTTATQQRGQFERRTNTEAYLRDGRFDQDRMLEAFEQLAILQNPFFVPPEEFLRELRERRAEQTTSTSTAF